MMLHSLVSADSLKRDREDAGAGAVCEAPNDVQRLRSTDEEYKFSSKRWTPEQDEALRKAVEEFGQRNWKSIAERVPDRNHAQCLQRWNKVLKPGLVKGHWSFEEDSVLERMVLQGCHSWGELSNSIPGRTAKQCRERWRNHLDPSINKSPFTYDEDRTIQQAYEQYGNRWTQIAELLPGRTEDAVKMRWKALNPNQTTNAKPGRPKLMPGMSTTSKSRSTPPNPDNMIATVMTPPSASRPQATPKQQIHGQPLPQQPAQPIYNYSPRAQVYQEPPMTMAAPIGYLPQQPQYQQFAASSSSAYPDNVVRIGTSLEPSVEPLRSHDNQEEVNEKDAAYLNELLRSQSNSLLSFGSTRGGGLSSFSDISPEDLLASGELDALFRAVSLANQDQEGTPSRKASRDSETNNARGASLTSSLLSSFGSLEDGVNLQKALASMGTEDKHIFQELIDELRASGHTRLSDARLSTDFLNDSNRLSFTSSSGRNLLNSLELNRKSHEPVAEGNQAEISEDAFDNLLDSDLMKPIRKGKRLN